VTQIFAKEKGIVLVALHKDILGLLGNDHGKGEAEDDQDDEACPGKELDQTKLSPFLGGMGVGGDHLGGLISLSSS
jgi:hypothetical protein